MNQKTVTIIDYGMGNLWSVCNSTHYLGYNHLVSSDPDVIANAELLLLPGVGSFRKAMISLEKTGLSNAIIAAVENKGSKILGICLGMQLLGESSSEDGETLGLGLIKCRVDKFTNLDNIYIKVPHVGFNTVFSLEDSILFNGLRLRSDFYFVHSYRMLPFVVDGRIAICHYGDNFVAAYERDNIFATQFHPEKSQSNGLILIKNFVNS